MWTVQVYTGINSYAQHAYLWSSNILMESTDIDGVHRGIGKANIYIMWSITIEKANISGNYKYRWCAQR